MPPTTSLSILGFWTQADAVGKSAALLLLAMSVTTWCLILTRAWQAGRTRRPGSACPPFQPASLEFSSAASQNLCFTCFF